MADLKGEALRRVLESASGSMSGFDWSAWADYTLDRMGLGA